MNLEFVTNVTLGVCASLCDSFAPRTATQPRSSSWSGEDRCVAFQHNSRTKKCGLKRVRTRAADAWVDKGVLVQVFWVGVPAVVAVFFSLNQCW